MSTSHRSVGECPLTPAELRVLELLMEGQSYEQIAASVGRATSTVRTQLHTAYRRLGVTTSYQAVLECVRAGWLCWSDDDPQTAILLRVEGLLHRLIDAMALPLEHRALTDAQRDYLERLDEHLHAADAFQRGLTRARLDGALAAMLRDAQVSVSAHRGATRDLVDTLGLVVDSHSGRIAA